MKEYLYAIKTSNSERKRGRTNIRLLFQVFRYVSAGDTHSPYQPWPMAGIPYAYIIRTIDVLRALRSAYPIDLQRQ